MAKASPTIDLPSIDSLLNSFDDELLCQTYPSYVPESAPHDLGPQHPDVVPAAHITLLGLASTSPAAESQSWACWSGPGLTEGEQWLALRMDEEVRTLLGKLGLEITLRQWEEYIGACQALPAEAPNDKEEVAWEDAMELVCDRHKLPWGPVAAVWLMQLFKLRLLQVLKEGREGTSGSDMGGQQAAVAAQQRKVLQQFIAAISGEAVRIWMYLNWLNTLKAARAPGILKLLCDLTGLKAQQVKDKLTNNRRRLQLKRGRERSNQVQRTQDGQTMAASLDNDLATPMQP